MTYSNYSDDELIEAYTTMIAYSGEPTIHMQMEIDERGGIDNFKRKINLNQTRAKEQNRIYKEVYRLVSNETNYEFVRKFISSDIFSESELDEIVQRKFSQISTSKQNLSITSRTIWGCIIGMVCGSIASSIVSVFLIQYSLPLTLLVIITYLICYGIIWLITKQTRNNILVFVTAFLATVISLFLDFYIQARVF